MRRSPFVSAALVVVSSALAFAQPSPPTPSTDGLELLKRVARQYSDAKSYYIQSVEERTSSSEYDRSWQKTTLTAAEAPGNRYYYEGRSNTGRSVNIADGKTVWRYRADEHRYTAKAQAVETSSKPAMTVMSEMAMMEAKNLRKNLGALAKPLKSADLLPDAILVVNGHKVSCHVVRFRNSDEHRMRPDFSFDKTIWIDKTHETVLKINEHAHTYLLSGAAHIPMEQETITTFTTTELNSPVRETLFSFIPPFHAKLLEDFPDPRDDFGGSNMTGDQVPALKLKSADGKVILLASFRGKPVLLDFWATWCGPCMAALPQLAQIYQEAKDKGLVLIAVDTDQGAKTAADLLSKKGYLWPNFHDDGEIETLMGSSGIPRTVLIDGQGKIVYDRTGSDEEELRTAIAKLGPEYASLLPKPKQAPCIASK